MGSAIGMAVGIGIAVAVQVAVLGRASRTWHPLSISLALQFAGVLAGVIWALHHRAWPEVWQVTAQWWWLALGALGWGIVAALGFTAARAGVSRTLAVVVVAQLLAGLVLDQVGGQLEVGVRHPVGVALLVMGLLLVSGRG